MFAGTFMAIYEKDIKRLLAHSSVAQIGYIFLGISLATSTGIASGFIHLVNHALIKAGLFMSVVAMGFYLQKRIGRNYCQFGCIKFRTMYAESDDLLSNLLAKSPALKIEFEMYFLCQYSNLVFYPP